MRTSATKVKARWNSEHYTQLKISVSPELAAAFKTACAQSNVSMTSKLSQFMADYSDTASKTAQPADFTKRSKRRTAIAHLILQLETIRDAEAQYMDNIPLNLQGSTVYETAEQSVSCMDEAIELLSSVY